MTVYRCVTDPKCHLSVRTVGQDKLLSIMTVNYEADKIGPSVHLSASEALLLYRQIGMYLDPVGFRRGRILGE